MTPKVSDITDPGTSDQDIKSGCNLAPIKGCSRLSFFKPANDMTYTPTIQCLLLSTCLFFAISTAQIISAVTMSSIALKADAIVMFTDVVCLLAALYGEAIDLKHADYKRTVSSMVSFFSIVVLLGSSFYFLMASIKGISVDDDIKWSLSASEQLGNPFSDIFGRNSDGIVEYGLPRTVAGLVDLSAPQGVLTPSYRYNGVSAVRFDGILPYNVTHDEACPDLGPGDRCDMDDASSQSAVVLAFALVGILVDMLCLAYAPSRKWRSLHLSKRREGQLLEREKNKVGENKEAELQHININILAAYAHIIASFIRSMSTAAAASYILAVGGNLAHHGGAVTADSIAGAASASMISLGSLYCLWEWAGEGIAYRQRVLLAKIEGRQNNGEPSNHLSQV